MKTNENKVREEVKARLAILREQFDLHPNVIDDYKRGVLNRSEAMRFGASMVIGALYWLSDDEKEIVKNVEKECNIKVFHVIKTNTTMGLMYSMLYVSDYPEEWERDREEMKEGYPFAYVYNYTYVDYSEFGHIAIKKGAGGLVRVFD